MDAPVPDRRHTAAAASLPVVGIDHLTGLADRGGFMAVLEETLALRGSEEPLLLLLDLDRFKAVNDAYGHPVGDALLVSAAGRIRAALRQGDVVGRIGGDEFAVLLRPSATVQETRRIAERLVDLLGRPFLVEGRVAQVGASVGVARATEGVWSSAQLMKRADLALYAAKARGRGRVADFEPALEQAAEEHMALETELRAALPLGQFELHYQPLLDLRSQKVIGFEALLRWRHPKRGMIAPGRILPLAEEINLMPAIGAWVLRQACRDAMTWPEGMRVSVNAAPSQLVGCGLPKIVRAALAESGLPGARLEIEVTEHALIDALARGVPAQFSALAAMGVDVALDDFGSGYASLAQLGNFRFQRMKIDRSFATDARMLDAAVGVGRALGLHTTAEGIEDAAQLDAAISHGCEVGQGFLIGRPMAPAAMREFLAERTRR
jgi:diguanylate cyclase (GGDEF)-like protein